MSLLDEKNPFLLGRGVSPSQKMEFISDPISNPNLKIKLYTVQPASMILSIRLQHFWCKPCFLKTHTADRSVDGRTGYVFISSERRTRAEIKLLLYVDAAHHSKMDERLIGYSETTAAYPSQYTSS